MSDYLTEMLSGENTWREPGALASCAVAKVALSYRDAENILDGPNPVFLPVPGILGCGILARLWWGQ